MVKNSFFIIFHKIMSDCCFLFFFTAGSFFLTGPIWARTVFCIDIGYIVLIYVVKKHLPHIYMIFFERQRKQPCPSILRDSETFQNFQDHTGLFQALRASNSLDPVHLLKDSVFLTALLILGKSMMRPSTASETKME